MELEKRNIFTLMLTRYEEKLVQELFVVGGYVLIW